MAIAVLAIGSEFFPNYFKILVVNKLLYGICKFFVPFYLLVEPQLANKNFPHIFTMHELIYVSFCFVLSLGDIVLYNIFYEVTKLCTSIIAETPQGIS